MNDPSSHSFRLSDRAGTNIYSPYRDGPVSSGWRALPNSHNTMAPNASLHFSWKGTAITINGYANSSQGPPAYMLSLDGQPPTREVVDEGRTKAEVLLSKTGLPLAYHTIVLSNIAGGNLTVKDLLLTISTGASGLWSQTSIDATIGSSSVYTPNPFFTFNGNWFPAEVSYRPSMFTTATDNASSVLSFTLSKCSAFFLYGPMTPGSGAPYNIKITPPVRPSGQSFFSLALNSTLGQAFNSARTTYQDEILFWENDMDRNKNYIVDITILPGLGQWGIRKLETYDSDPFFYKEQPLALIIIGPAIVFIVLFLCCFGCSKKARQQVQVWCGLRKKN